MRRAAIQGMVWLAAVTAVSALAMAQKATVPAGTRVLIRMIDSVDSSKQKAGDRFTATLETNLQVDDEVIAPRGTKVLGRLTNAKSAGRMSGAGELTLELTDIVINGNAYPLVTSTYEVRSEGKGKKTARRIVGGAGLGALIGGIAGGGTGAAIGVAAGAAGGTAVAAAKGGKQVQVQSEALLEFRVEHATKLPVGR